MHTPLRINHIFRLIITRSSATAEIARDARNDHSKSLKVIRCYANRRGIYNLLLALNSNLTSIFILQPFLRCHAYFAHPYPTSLLGGTGKRRLVVVGMLWC